MDTPGFYDTEGINQDMININNILGTVSLTPELNAVLIMMNGSEQRISIGVNYTIQGMKGIMPNVLKENVMIHFHSVSVRPNADYKELGFLLPEDRVFCTDNSMFSHNISNLT